MAKAIENISLGVDTKKFEAAVKLDAKLFEQIKVIDAIVSKSIGGGVDDYNTLLDNPITYLSELYWARFGDKFPSNADRKETFLRQSNFSESQILSITDSIQGAISKLRNHKPVIEGNTITSGVNKEAFEITVHKNKVQAYKLIKSVLRDYKSLSALHRFPQSFHLQRMYAPMLEMRGGMLKPSRQWFTQA